MKIICLASSAAMQSIAATLTEAVHIPGNVEIITGHYEYTEEQVEELRKNMTQCIVAMGTNDRRSYEPKLQAYKIREGGKGRNRGKNNRDWWNK